MNETITVINENGEKITLEYIDSIKLQGNEYVIAGPKESQEVYAYKMVINNGEAEFRCLGEGQEFDRVLNEYNRG